MITIKNDNGGVIGTQILAEDGTDLCKDLGVIGLSIEFADANAAVTASVRLAGVKTEVTSGAVEWQTINPISGAFEAVRTIIFASGDSIGFHEDGNVTRHPKPVAVCPISSGRTHKLRAPSDHADNRAGGDDPK